MKNRIRIFILLGVLLVGSTGVVTYAYLTDSDSRPNQLNLAGNQVHIEEKFNPPDHPKPGDVISKKPCVVNDSEVPVYVRVSVHFSDSDGLAQCQPLEINPGWSLADDGFYYYDTALAPGKKTVNLFENITLKEASEIKELVSFDVLVYAESVQCYGFSTAEEAFAALQDGGEK